MKTDLIIIGSGPGGYRAAEYAVKQGLQVVVIEAEDAGGTCLNRGCIPTKTLCRSAEVIDTLKDAEALGLGGLQYSLDFARIMARQTEVVAGLRSGVEFLMSQPGITFVRGKASFTAPKTIVAAGEEYTAPNIIIATGARPKIPAAFLTANSSSASRTFLTSDELLRIDHLPARLCIIGAGVIGMEFASAFSSFGSEVTVVEYLKECLPALDSDVAARLRKAVARKGVTFFMQSAVTSVADGSVTFERKGKSQTIEADTVLVATGRTPNVEELNLKAAGVQYDAKGIVTDDNMQTNVEGVYAIGDVNARCMLAHAATMQGLHVVNRIVGRTDDIRLDIMPQAVFTNPEAASVGVSEDYCKNNNIDYRCGRALFRANGKALAMGEAEGLLKLLTDAGGRIIGCHVYGAHAADIVQTVSALMCRDTTVCQLKDMVHTHPTIGEILQDAALAM